MIATNLRSRYRLESMIARIWRGWTTPDKADAYQHIVSTQVLPEIASRNLDGYHGTYLLRREIEGEVEFSTIMLFDSIDTSAALPVRITRSPMFRPRPEPYCRASTRGQRTTRRSCWPRKRADRPRRHLHQAWIRPANPPRLRRPLPSYCPSSPSVTYGQTTGRQTSAVTAP
jgi:hypothetical protein